MILVTGAAGKTGQAVLQALRAKGLATRGFVRRPEQREGLGADEVLIGDMSDVRAAEQALHGIDAVYLICPNVHSAELKIVKTWIAVARRMDIRRFVYHSVLFPQIEAMPHHWQKLRAEEALIQAGMDFTIIQPASYMQNIQGYLATMRAEGIYRVPYSVDAKFTPVDLEDVAAVAAEVLTEPGHSGGIYSLAGSELLSSRDMAQATGEALGIKVVAVRQSLDEWRSSAKGLPKYGRDVLIKMFEYYDQHGFAGNSTTLTTLLGRTPTTFSQYLRRELK